MMPDYPYFTQCDKLRSQYQNGESFWQTMMDVKQPVSLKKASKKVRAKALLDEDESLADLFSYHLQDDPKTQFYQSNVDGITVYFLQTAGFEFIFVRDQDQQIFKKLSLAVSPTF